MTYNINDMYINGTEGVNIIPRKYSRDPRPAVVVRIAYRFRQGGGSNKIVNFTGPPVFLNFSITNPKPQESELPALPPWPLPPITGGKKIKRRKTKKRGKKLNALHLKN